MSKKRKCHYCGADITHKNYTQRVDNGVIVKICMECEKKNAKNFNSSAINRMCSSMREWVR